MGRRGNFSILIRLARRGDISLAGFTPLPPYLVGKTARTAESSVFSLADMVLQTVTKFAAIARDRFARSAIRKN
jgi:hypothetical protein